MTLTFVSNFLNHHQLFLCNEFAACTEFHFVATDYGGSQGYQRSMLMPYVVVYDANDEEKRKFAIDIIMRSDVVIFGSCPTDLIAMRMRENKLSFLYTERWLRKGLWRRFLPSVKKKLDDLCLNYKDKKLYVLSASSYLMQELSVLRFPLEKCYKWGYFPELKDYDRIEKNTQTKRPAMILWAARFIAVKHPETPVKIAEELRKKGYDFVLEMAGDGKLKKKIEKLIKQKRLGDYVHLIGSLSAEEVRKKMMEDDIFLFTSDKREGWGAVVNEAMNSGCAVVSSDGAGATRFLIKDGFNGLIFKCGSQKDLFKKISFLLDDPSERRRIGNEAYGSIVSAWNYKVACRNFLTVASALLNGEKVDIADGPMSPL